MTTTRLLLLILAALLLTGFQAEPTPPHPVIIDIDINIGITLHFSNPPTLPSATPTISPSATPFPDPTPTRETVRFACVTGANGVNVRSVPTTQNNTPIGVLQFGERIELIENLSAWWRIRYRGRAAFVAGLLMREC